MKKQLDIKDFIGTKTAIHCATQEEWDYIRVLDPKQDGVIPSDQFPEQGKGCILVEGDTFYFGSCGYYTSEGYTILPASDFMPKEDRYIEKWVWKEGYKDKYLDAARAIIGTWVLNYFSDDSEVAKVLREAGVLSLWFEPVYKEAKVWPKKGTPCLVWDNNSSCASFVFYVGGSRFSAFMNNEGKGIEWNNYIELNLTEEQLSKLP